MRIGVLELLTGNGGTGGVRAIGSHFYTKQYASIMPQAIAVWCREFGHEVFYATFAGLGDPKRSLPNDLDVVFIGANTPASALAYALAKLYRRERTLTVIGGPHARSYARDCQRFFDIVVLRCDRALVADIVGGVFEPGSIVSSERTLTDLPSVEERMPEIRAAYFYGGRANPSTTVGILASVGCPYTCNFCTDWNSPYALLSLDRLAADLQYVSQHLPGVRVAFHDPNFAVKFDPVLEVLEQLPPEKRNPYAMESSLSVLRGARLQRLKDTRCLYVAPGVESWSSYSNKAQAGAKTGSEKLRIVVEQFNEIHEYVPGLQANFILGIDADAGDEPVALTKQFISETPFVWPALNIPTPFGGTPFFDDCLRDGRILKTMPFALYYVPYLVMKLRNYDAITYYENLIEIGTHLSSSSMLWRRLRTTPSRVLQFLHIVRTRGTRNRIRDFREIVRALREDPAMLAFHEGLSGTLPAFYERKFNRMLGSYAALLSPEDLRPVLDQPGKSEAHAVAEGQPQPIALAT